MAVIKVSLFAEQERETRLDKIGDALSKLAEHVEFAALAIYKPDYRYAKAGVMLMDLRPDTVEQRVLALEANTEDRQDPKLMLALNAINRRFGRGAVHVASTGATQPHRAWGMRQERRTPAYTTDWWELALVR